jgi:two-component system cell cycle sensor histidine kinase PleC
LPDGTATHESIATPVLDATGTQVTHIIVIMRDVEERLKHERELRDALQKAEAANKSKSEFLASMSHELRTPLNAVLGYSELLTHGIGGQLSDKQAQYVEYIHKSGSHLLKIIADILDLSKIEAGQFVLYEEVAEIAALIDVCLLMIRERAAAKGLLLIEDFPQDLPAIRVDVLRMKQIILNLLSNAVKFTGNGSVTLSIRHDAATGLTIAISDTGIGMAQSELAVALEPFGQVESAFARNHDGTGLGLPIARHLVELHGGRLQIASQQGEGTTVAITIPPERVVVPATVSRVA